MTTQSMRHFIAVAMVWLLAVGQTLACTSFIVSGRVTKSGRPMIFKNRDTGNLDNCMVAMQGERYRFMGVAAAKDTADSLEICSASKRQLVNARLRAVCGEDLTKYDKKLANSVQRIVKRGKIRNGNEYEKVRTYIDSIEGEPEHEALLQDLYRMTGDFESAVGDDPSLIGEEWR
jgi:hypothetical protein